MKIYTTVIIPVLVSGTRNEEIVPVNLDDGQLSVRVRANLVSNNPEIRESSVYTGVMRLAIPLTTSHINTSGYWGFGSELTFLDGIGGDVVATRGLFLSTVDSPSHLGLDGLADIYRAFPQGIMLYPGRLRANFPEDTRISMILDQERLEDGRYCAPGSLFYVRRSFNSVYVETKIVPHGVDAQPDWYFDIQTYSIDIQSGNVSTSDEMYDVIPGPPGVDLVNIILPGQLSGNLPEYMESCDLVNGNYPSIHFRIVEPPWVDDRHVHRGTIVYDPEDYLQPTGDGRCRFKIRNNGDHPRFGLNFLTKVAMHFKSGQFGFCDPALPTTNL